MTNLQVNGISFQYSSLKVIENITFSVEKGDCLAILGKNGVGKSTLLKCINRILKAQSGAVCICEKDIRRMGGAELAQKVGYVLQSSQFSETTVFDAVLIGRKPYINWDVTRKDFEIINEVLTLLSLQDYSMRPVNCLSGGEMQKVAIARALAQQPDVLMFDEPTSNLDLKNQLDVIQLIKEIVKKRNISAIVTMHDLNMALRFANKFIMMKQGRIHAIGGVEIINPENIKQVYDVSVSIAQINGGLIVIPI